MDIGKYSPARLGMLRGRSVGKCLSYEAAIRAPALSLTLCDLRSRGIKIRARIHFHPPSIDPIQDEESFVMRRCRLTKLLTSEYH